MPGKRDRTEHQTLVRGPLIYESKDSVSEQRMEETQSPADKTLFLYSKDRHDPVESNDTSEVIQRHDALQSGATDM